MSDFLYFQSIVQYRIPVSGGQPEIMKKFTVPIKGAQHQGVKKPQQQTIKTEQVTEEWM